MVALRFLPCLWPRALCWRSLATGTASAHRKLSAAAAASDRAAGASGRRLNLQGIYPPLATPFTLHGEVDYARLEENMRLYAGIPFRGRVAVRRTRATEAGTIGRKEGTL